MKRDHSVFILTIKFTVSVNLFMLEDILQLMTPMWTDNTSSTCYHMYNTVPSDSSSNCSITMLLLIDKLKCDLQLTDYTVQHTKCYGKETSRTLLI